MNSFPGSGGYNNYDNLPYNSTAGGGSTNWTWLPNAPNNTAGAAGAGPDIYSRSQWTGNQSTTGPLSGIRPGNSASKSGSEYGKLNSIFLNMTDNHPSQAF